MVMFTGHLSWDNVSNVFTSASIFRERDRRANNGKTSTNVRAGRLMAGCLHMYTLMAADNSVWCGSVLDLCFEYSAECRQYEIHRDLKCYVTKCVIEERAGYRANDTF